MLQRKRITALCMMALGFALVMGTGAFAKGVPLQGYTFFDATEGTSLETKDLVGTPTLLVFFTPSCPACKTELQNLDTTWKGYSEKWGLRVLPVAPYPLQPQAEKLKNHLKEQWGVTTLGAFVDGNPAIMEAHGVQYVPTLVLYDKEGKEVWKKVGMVESKELEKVFEKSLLP